jgi:hypothetical protein
MRFNAGVEKPGLESLREKSEKTLVFRIFNSPQNRHPERSATMTLLWEI